MEDYLKKLNPEQKAAVTHTYGPLMVLAGPGTGKTQILTSRIAHLLNTDLGVNPDNILCLTFTESGATAMKERLTKIIGPESYKIHISTFHGFCEMVLNQYSHYFKDLKQNRKAGEDIDKALALRKTLDHLKDLKHFKPYWDQYFYQKSLLISISKLKRENLSPNDLRALIPQEEARLMADPDNFYKRAYKDFKPGDFKPQNKHKIETKVEKMGELAHIWEAYENQLVHAGLYDFDDQINWVVENLCKNEYLRADLQERFQWILVDEYQDTNNAQNAILWKLCANINDPNIMVVGDDDQSIYRFQGASIENMLDFKKRFPHHTTITLRQNYRSTQTILDVAFEVVQNNTQRLDPEKKLVSNTESTSPSITSNLYPSPIAEANAIADQIQQLGPSKYQETAILVRTNKEIDYYMNHLGHLGIPFQAHISEDLLSHSSVRYLILMMKVLSDHSNDQDLIALLHAHFLDIPAGDLMKLSLHRSAEKKSILKLLSEDNLPDLKAPEPLKAFYQFFIEARKDFYHLRPAVLAEKLVYESGLANYLNNVTTQQRNNETTLTSSSVAQLPSFNDWHYVRSFIDWIRDQNIQDTKELLDKIDLHHTLGIEVIPPSLVMQKKAVQLLTAHRSKGLEFERVFIPGLWDKRWGNNKGRDMIPLPQLKNEFKSPQVHKSSSLNEDERRLFFVALTRAKKELHLSYPQQDFSGREKNPSMFWHEIPDKLQNLVTQQLNNSTTLISCPVDQLTSLEDENIKPILESRVKNFVWSASSLQSYLSHPRQFLYQTLLRYPRRTRPHMALGVALHQALELYLREQPSLSSSSLTRGSSSQATLDTLIESKHNHKEKLLTHFQYALTGQNITKNEYETLEKHGLEILSNYFDQKLSTESLKKQDLEFDFNRFKPIIKGIPIRGKVDKITYLDEKQKTAKIVDYKSGKPKPIRHGESLWRQMVFYDLLAQSSAGFKTQILSTEIEFLTPNTKGMLETKSYEVTPEDRQELIQELIWADQQIKALNFPAVDNPSQDPDIEFWNTFAQ